MSKNSLPLPFFEGNESNDLQLPLPLQVAQKWAFPLSYISQDDGTFLYCLRDWLVGLTDSANVSQLVRNLRFKGVFSKNAPQVNGVEYLNDKELYRVAQELRSTKTRIALDAIKQYLADAGAFVDAIRRDPEKLADAAVAGYISQGKDPQWAETRVSGKINRQKFTDALKNSVYEALTEKHYRHATDDLYVGLWERTSAQLRDELHLKPRASLRDNQPRLALQYQSIAEEMIASRLGTSQELTWHEAESIVIVVANLIGKQARETGAYMGIDLATGKPLLAKGGVS